MMRIAIFSEVYWPMVSGVSLTLQRLTRALAGRGHAVRVYAATYPLPPGMPDRSEVHRSPSRPLFLSPEVQWAFPQRAGVRRDLLDFGPDLIHLATEFPMGLTGLKLGRELEIPLIASAHTDYERYAARYGLDWAVAAGWTYLRWFYHQTERVLCPSQSYAAHLEQRGIRHTGIWSRGVNTSQFHPGHRSREFRERLGLADKDPLILYVGRLAPEKGIDRLLDAWELLGGRRGRAKLLFVGDGLMLEPIRRRRLPGVELAGPCHGDALSTAYASADILAFPSTTETFGNVLLEGMASGLACVAMNTGGVTEYAVHGQNALLVEPGEQQAFGDALERLLGDPALRAGLGTGGRATAEARGWGPIFDRLLDDYTAVVSRGRDERAA